jgi:hypothetical protein
MNTVSFACDFYITIVDRDGRGSVFRDQCVLQDNVLLPMESIHFNAVMQTYLDGEPHIVIAAYGKRSGVYLLHAMTLGEVRSLPFKRDVSCVCIDVTGTKAFFGTESG